MTGGGTAPVLIAACGNRWAGDDAFGPLVAEHMRTFKLAGVEVADLGMRPAALLDLLPGRIALGVVDAADAPGLAAGQFIELDWFDPRRPALLHDDVLSTHGLSLAHQLELARPLGLLPLQVRLFAIARSRWPQPSPPSGSICAQVELMGEHIRHWCAPLTLCRQ